MKRILIATGLYPPDIGGPATYAMMVEETLPAHDWVTEVVPFGEVRGYPKVIRHIVYCFKLLRRAKEADVVYALDPVSVGLPATFAAKLRGKPLLLRLGGDYAWEQARQRYGITESLDAFVAPTARYPLMVRVLRWLQTYVAKQAVVIITPSQYLKDIVTQWGISEDKIRVIYSALHPISVPGSREVLRKELGFAGPTIVSAARLVPWKGFAELIAVTATLKESFPKLQLVIVGDGPDEATLRHLTHEAGIEAQVQFTGRLEKAELGKYIKAADVFVLNTAYEGLSHQLLEVMDIGTPVVTTAVGGNLELVEDGVNGRLVAYGDQPGLAAAIAPALTGCDATTAMVQRARLTTKRFTEADGVTQLAALLNDCV